MTRPVLYVLAGVNGAGKSSIGGHLLEREGLTWFNPDTFARELKAATGCNQETANAHAWQEGMRRLDEAMAKGLNHACETTLGGKTVTARILQATKTHDVLIWFCGLSSPELHIARVRARVTAGGHPIPEEKIRERYPLAQLNLIKLMPHATYIKVYDNSVEAAADGTVPDPLLVLEMENGQVISPAPDDLEALQRAPEWTKSILEAACRCPRPLAPADNITALPWFCL
ncbi:MAG TPA: AAA family ATPase [Steroidobacteraceae bacterium]|nr:AAA family ATPase [Steroidobacteraceae bacterium]